MRVAGIDYSLTSPAICVGDEGARFEDCQLYCFGKKKFVGTYDNITVMEYPKWSHRIERYKALAEWTLSILDKHTVERVSIEGYAYGAKGRSTLDIAENGGILRYLLSEARIQFDEPAPTQIKKLASGKGNSNKNDMYAAFLSDTGKNIMIDLQTKTEVVGNPTSDLVDAYYVFKSISGK